MVPRSSQFQFSSCWRVPVPVSFGSGPVVVIATRGFSHTADKRSGQNTLIQLFRWLPHLGAARSIAFGNHCLVISTFTTIHLFQFPFADTDQYCRFRWVDHCDVWCGFTLASLKRTGDETLSSGLMLVTFVTTDLFQFYFADTVHSRIQVVCSFFDRSCR